MAEFLGPSAGIEGPLAAWGEYWGNVDEQARLRYNHREIRDERDREHRYQLERGRSNQAAYGSRGEMFRSADERLADMGVRNVPSAAPTTAGLTPEQVAGNTQAADYMTRSGTGGLPVVNNVAEEMRDYHFRGMLAALPQLIVSERDMTPMQRTRWTQLRRAYGRLTRGQISAEDYRARLEVAAREGIINPNQPSIIPRPEQNGRQREFIDATGGTSATTSIPPAYDNTEVPETPETDRLPYDGPNLEMYPGGLEPPDATNETGRARDPDTSAALRPTPEMDMIEAAVQDQLRLANIAASHGRNAEAEQMFALALQGQAAYLQQERLVMLRAGMQGHRTALADLLGLYSGRQPGTTQIQPTAEDRNQFNLQYLNSEGQWVNSPAGPFTLERLVGMAELLVDRESVMARSEANMEFITARIRAGADIQVASINALTAQQRMYFDAFIAQQNNATAERIAQGNAELVIDSANNTAYLQWWEPGPNGQPIQRMEEITQRDVRVADSNGRRTERQRVSRPITGINNVRGSN